jgi:drug/metabolite transporter (DMT)-like permease
MRSGFREQDHTLLPNGRDIPLLFLGVIGIGMSGPLIALSTMPIVALIFWRNLAGAILMAPFAARVAFRTRQLQDPQVRQAIRWSALAGVVLALHFMGFFISMRMTSVAAGTALTALQPIFAAIYIRFLGGHIPTRAWLGMVISFLGVLVITGVDLTLSWRAFLGDIAAIICAALSALYLLIGAKAQRTIQTSLYTSVCYGACALTAIPMMLFTGDAFTGYPIREWLLLLALIAAAQMLGHTMFNFTLKRLSPTVVSLIVFFEVPVGALFAWWWIGQVPPVGTIPGILILLLGSAIFVTKRGER